MSNSQQNQSSVESIAGGRGNHATDASSSHRWFVISVAVLTSLVVVGVILGMNSRTAAQTQLHDVALETAAPAVVVIHPLQGVSAEELDLPGNMQAFNDTPIYARTSGYVKRWLVDIGAHVRQGQVLAVVETPELDQQLDQARAELKNAEANLQIAEITAKRWQNLLRTNAVSQQEADQAQSDFTSKQALVASSKANVDRLLQLQAFERITAPFNGVITARNTDIGALIQAGDNSSPKEIFHIAATQKLRVYISVPEIDAAAIRDGQKVTLSADAFPKTTFEGVIVRNSNSIDSNSRTLNVEVDVENASGQLLPGAYAIVHLKVPGDRRGVTIPANALLFRSEGLRAAVVNEGHVKLAPIVIGQDYGNTVEVVAGLTPKDSVVVNPADSLADGAQVRPRAQSNSGVKP